MISSMAASRVGRSCEKVCSSLLHGYVRLRAHAFLQGVVVPMSEMSTNNPSRFVNVSWGRVGVGGHYYIVFTGNSKK